MKMNFRIGSIIMPLVLPLLAVPALCSCAVDSLEHEFSSMDGKPVANYTVSGKVTDEDGAPIQDIRVIADHSGEISYRADTLYTGKDGSFSKFLAIPLVDGFRITFDDIDGEANGGFFKSVSEYVVPKLTEVPTGMFGGSFLVSIDRTLVKR